MFRSSLTRIILISVTAYSLIACAKVGAPTGGPRDKLSPVVIKEVPANGTKNYRGNNLIITFDEYVVLDNINEKFMVSPPLSKKPVIYIRGKNVNVEFDEELKDSTTYTFYFQDAIKDLNEGNVIENYQFVFSTGPVIDSLSVTGNVSLSLSLESPEKTLVLLYRNLADSAVNKNLPDYISRVDRNGYFRINNISPGRYNLYALKDADNSKNYNLVDEEFAFLDTSIMVSPEKNFIPVVKDTTSIKKKPEISQGPEPEPEPEPAIEIGDNQLFLFTATKKDHYLTSSSRDLQYQLMYTLSLPPDTMKFIFSIPGAAKDSYFIEQSKNRDTLKVWLTDSTLYSQQQITTVVLYPFTDTLKTLGYREDTILLRFLEVKTPRSVKVKKPVFTISTNIVGGSIKPGQRIIINSQTPIKHVDTTLIHLYDITEKDRLSIKYNLKKDTSNSTRYYLTANLLPKLKYLFVADSASVESITYQIIDSTGIKFSVKDPDTYSKLTLNIHNVNENLIIQLLSKNEKLVREVKINKDGKIAFPLLENGLYRVRVIYDINSDGKWTTGDFTKKQQPEPISFYPSEIDIKPGWEVEQDWDVSRKNFKDQALKTKKTSR